MSNKKQGNNYLRNAAIIAVIIVSVSIRPALELGVIVLVRRGAFPPLWFALVLIALKAVSFVLGEIAGSLRGRFYAMEYSNHERAEKLFGPALRRFSRSYFIV